MQTVCPNRLQTAPPQIKRSFTCYSYTTYAARRIYDTTGVFLRCTFRRLTVIHMTAPYRPTDVHYQYTNGSIIGAQRVCRRSSRNVHGAFDLGVHSSLASYSSSLQNETHTIGSEDYVRGEPRLCR